MMVLFLLMVSVGPLTTRTNIGEFPRQPSRQRVAEALNFSSFGADSRFFRLCRDAAVCRVELYAGFFHPAGQGRAERDVLRSTDIAVMDTNCGAPSDEFSEADNAAAQTWLHAWQHPADCATAKLGVIDQYHRGGIGSSLHFVVYTALKIMSEGRVAVFGPGQWRWADCAQGSPECYFLPFSSCRWTGHHSDALPYDNEYPPAPLHRPTGVLFQQKSWAFARSHVLRYLMRPRPEVELHVRSLVARSFPLGLPRPLASLFVRRQDKVLYENAAVSVDVYFDQLAHVAKTLRIRDVYLGTDDALVVEEARASFGGTFTIHTLDIERNFSLFNWMNETENRRKPLEEQMLASLADLYLQVHADVWVGTLSSNWCRLVDELRTAVGKTCFPFFDVEGLYLTEGTQLIRSSVRRQRGNAAVLSPFD